MAATRTTKGRTGRATRSRTEVQNEFAEINAEVTDAEAVDPKTASASRARAFNVRSAVQGVTVEEAVTAITQVQLGVQKALAGVSEQLLAKVNELKQVTEAVELEQKELAQLHKIDIAATSIDILLQDHAAKTKSLEDVYGQRERDFHTAEAEREKERHEREAAYATQAQREKDEYEYRKANERRAIDDQFQQQLLQRQRDTADRQIALERVWKEREEGLRAQETDITKVRQELIDLPIRLRKDFEAEKAIALNSLKSNLSHEYAIKEKDYSAEARVQQATIATLGVQLNAAVENVKQLQGQLDAANAKIESIANKAIDGAAERGAFERFMTVQKEQNNGTAAGRGKA